MTFLLYTTGYAVITYILFHYGFDDGISVYTDWIQTVKRQFDLTNETDQQKNAEFNAIIKLAAVIYPMLWVVYLLLFVVAACLIRIPYAILCIYAAMLTVIMYGRHMIAFQIAYLAKKKRPVRT